MPPAARYKHVFINTAIIDVIIGVQAGQYGTQEEQGLGGETNNPGAYVSFVRGTCVHDTHPRNEFSHLSEFLMCPIIDRPQNSFCLQICTKNVNIDN